MSKGRGAETSAGLTGLRSLPKRAGNVDIALLVALDQAIFPQSAYSHEGWGEEIQAAMVYIALTADTAAGFISLAWAGDDIEIRKIGVLAGRRRAGIARSLLQCAWQGVTGAQRILIDVAADNEAGIAFYSKYGFTEIARRKRYYPHGADAVVMAASGIALHKIMSAPSAK